MLAALATALLGAPRATVTVSDRSEVRVRDSNEPTGRAVDLETAPSVSVIVDERRWRLDAGYTPRFTERALLRDSAVRDIYQSVYASASWQHRQLRLSAREQASFGDQSFTSLGTLDAPVVPGVPGAERLPTSASLRYASQRSTVVARLDLSRRWALSTTLEYAASGGVDAASKVSIPLQVGPRVEELLEHQASRRDRISAGVTASHVAFSSGPEANEIEGALGWRRRFDRTIDLVFRAGSTLSSTRSAAGAPPAIALWPVADVSVGHQRVGAYSISGALRLGPIIDRLTGLIDERAQLSAAFRWKFKPNWTVRSELAASKSVHPSPGNAVVLAFGEAAVGWRPTVNAGFEGGLRLAWQRQDAFSDQPPQWVLFLAATFVTSPSEATPLPAFNRK